MTWHFPRWRFVAPHLLTCQHVLIKRGGPPRRAVVAATLAEAGGAEGRL